MKTTEKIVHHFSSDIANKTILEAACGSGDFSISAADYAREVFSVDLVDFRLNKQNVKSNMHFEIMDASEMTYKDEAFDTVFIYNAFSHIQDNWKAIEKECRRVLKPEGKIYVISTWKIDISSMKDEFKDKAYWWEDFFIAEIMK